MHWSSARSLRLRKHITPVRVPVVLLYLYKRPVAALASGVAAQTVTHLCEAVKRFPNGLKSSVWKGGRWLIPAGYIEAFLKRRVA